MRIRGLLLKTLEFGYMAVYAFLVDTVSWEVVYLAQEE